MGEVCAFLASQKLKFHSNQKRDEEVRQELEERQIKRLVVWECTIKKMSRDRETEKNVLDEAEKFLTSKDHIMEL